MELGQLKAIIDRPAQTITDSLTKKGWSVRPELSGVKENQLYRTFSFGNHSGNKNKALAWLRIQADNGVINQLFYQAPGVDQFNSILKELKESGTERKDKQSIEDNQVSTYYVGKAYTFQTIVGASSYTVMVMTNQSL